MCLQIFNIFVIIIHAITFLPDMDCLSKSQLQNYARKNNLDPPVFTIKIEGLPHDIRYKAIVDIDGKSFESPTFFNTIKEAEQAAAKFALRELPISVDLFQKVSVLEISYVIPN